MQMDTYKKRLLSMGCRIFRGYCKACIGSLLTDVALGNFVLDYQLKRTISAVLLRIENKAINLPVRRCGTGLNDYHWMIHLLNPLFVPFAQQFIRLF